MQLVLKRLSENAVFHVIYKMIYFWKYHKVFIVNIRDTFISTINNNIEEGVEIGQPFLQLFVTANYVLFIA